MHRDFLGNRPGIFLMTMFLKYGKARLNMARPGSRLQSFSHPSMAHTKTLLHQAKSLRRIENLTKRTAHTHTALRADGSEFNECPDMGKYIPRNSGHSKNVNIRRRNEPTYELLSSSSTLKPAPSPSPSSQEDKGATPECRVDVRRLQ